MAVKPGTKHPRTREDRTLSNVVQTRYTAADYAELRRLANAHDVAVSHVIRLLVRWALLHPHAAEEDEEAMTPEQLVGALVAADREERTS